MTGIHVEFAGGKNRFRPGEMLEGVVSWDLAAAPEVLEIRLLWRTQGKGTEDSAVVERVHVEGPTRSDRKPFRVPIPLGPYSFSGKLISLTWSIQAVVGTEARSELVNLTVSPSGEEILLHGKK